MKNLKSLFLLAGLTFLTSPTLSMTQEINDNIQDELEEKREIDDKWNFSLTFENDIFSKDDDNYTNGIRFSWLSPETSTPYWLEKVANATPFFNLEGNKRVAYSLGQNIYTPENTLTRALLPNQRPYAGWLYGSVGLISDTGSTLERLELTAGVVGPSALGEQSQNEIHRFRNIDTSKGWDNQLKDEPGFILSYENAWKNYADFGLEDYGFGEYGVDFTPKAGFMLGNVHTNASIGATARFGKDLPSDYGPPKIRPRMPGSEFFVPKKDSSFGWYLFADAEVRAVAQNIFLDGNTWKDSHSVDKKNIVGDIQAGLAFSVGDYRIAYTHVFRTKEFDQQSDDIESFGGITVTMRY